jgi:hypothetical protein
MLTLRTLLFFAATVGSPTLVMTTLSSRPDMVSGGDALVEIRPIHKVDVKLNGRDVSKAFHEDAKRGSMVGLVAGLRVGANTLVAKEGGHSATLELINHPITGPIVSGEHLKPFVCETEESGLGPALDADCSAATKIEYFYKTQTGKFLTMQEGSHPEDVAQTTTSDGKTVPYVVKVESGTINRSIYRIAMLESAWNQRILYTFGGGCGTNYNQGKNTAESALFDPALSRGFAHITSTQNVMQQHCNDNLSGEALMMIKEHFIKTYGVPAWTMGFGGSGGSIQQLLIAQNFPGLLDGLLPSLTYPDSISTRPDVTDCRLLMRYFDKDQATWTKDKQQAVEGYTPGTCGAWNRSFIDIIVAAYAKGCGIPADQVYDAVKNPHGARCTVWDTNVATFGRDPATGFAREALDNTGVQYGLKALNDGAIGKNEFLALNRGIGGYDRDGVPRAERSTADLEAVRLAYAAGRIDEAGGSLGSIPLLHYRSYNDPLGDIHDRIRDFVVRERLRRANGRTDNQVLWVFPNGDRAQSAKISGIAIDTMTKWLDGIQADNSGSPAIEKVVRAKPASAVDGCWTADGTRIDDMAKCNQIFPTHLTPRLVAGAPLTDDIMKCQLKPLNRADYQVQFSADEWKQLGETFPIGVCDYSKPGVNQAPLAGTWLRLPLQR